ncbi:response regulator [Myroides sp. M-43]|uniref:response regulator n=1 Tax=Myroides oncorhynchi TaxID=2893756 RepID=UPI001E3A7526|nr:response regulator [Myroides oncorhynchi]MCC9042404.1 response regulator [Myroides oncorhynchi]
MSKVLLVDDHPLIVEGYVLALSKEKLQLGSLEFEKSFDCCNAKEIIDQTVQDSEQFDLAIIDFSLPNKENSLLKDGGDIVGYIKKLMPNCRTIILTGHTEVITIYNIVKNIRPDGLVSKHEITPDNLLDIVKRVLNGERYQSDIVKHCLNEIVRKEVMYDDYNREILVLLSKGYKLQELENHIPLSNPAIKKRLAKMKHVFGVSDTANLIQLVLKEGFV